MSSIPSFVTVISLALAALFQGPGPQPPTQQPAQPALPWRPLPSPVPEDEIGDAVAIKVGRAITISGEPVDDATILVRGGKIVAIGKLVDVPKGARQVDYSNLTAMPGLVVAHARAGFVQKAPPQGATAKGRDGADPKLELYKNALGAGITTMVVVPPGSGITGSASVVRTRPGNDDDWILSDDAYLASTYEPGAQGKDGFRQALTRAKEEMERVEKAIKDAKETKDPAPAPAPSASQPASQPSTGAASQPAAAKPPAAPPKADPKIEPVIKVIKKERKLLTSFGAGSNPLILAGFGRDGTAADILHFQDAVNRFDIDRIYVGGQGLALVINEIKSVNASVLLAPDISFEPGTRNRVNAADELRRAGVKVAFIPPAESRDGFQNWLFKVADIVKMGMPEADALRAMTLTPAELLGLGSRVGALAAGHDADILFFDGPPLEVASKLKHIMVAGEWVDQKELQ